LKQEYDINVIDNTVDGIIVVSFNQKCSSYQLAVGCVYLPPENGEYGKNSDVFFNHLLNLSYNLSDFDMFLLGGDLNSRINVDNDYIPGLDNILPRQILDEVKNRHGDSFIEFLIESKMCIINGRVTKELDDFTSVSKKGKAIVDYFFCPHNCLADVEYFEVHRIVNLVNKLKISPEKLPDHSVLFCKLNTQFRECAEPEKPTIKDCKSKCVFKRNIPDNFLGIEHVDEIQKTIARIENTAAVQLNVNGLFDEICELYYSEMNIKLVKKKVYTGKKTARRGKPWWNKELERAWSEVSLAETNFVKAKGQSRQHLYNLFKDKRNCFDCKYNQAKRAFNRKERDCIAELNTDNPNAFWSKLKQMGPKKRCDIPLEIPINEGHSITEPQQVLHEWKCYFEGLYNNTDCNEIDENFIASIQRFKMEFEKQNPINPNFELGNSLNKSISLEEVQKAIYKSKNNKAFGVDGIPSEVYKNINSVHLWHTFFNYCFSTGLVPDMWNKGLIKPIPKGTNIDKRLPLNYRGICLSVTISKIYSSILNTRLLEYLETNEKLIDEQNGFRKLRSCVDHLYVLTTIIRNRKAQSLSTYVCFIDFAKAFDKVDRDSLFVKLAQAGVTGNMYWAISSLYNNPCLSILLNSAQTEWFRTTSGVKQGDNVSTSLFALYIDDLAHEINQCNLGLHLEDDFDVSILLYADDLALLAENEENLQLMVNIVKRWCTKWKMSVNTGKTKIVHYRKKSVDQSKFIFKFGNAVISYCSDYKYLGCILNEFLDYNVTSDILAKAAGRALGGIVSKYKYHKGLDYGSYTKLYHTCVCTVMDYGSAVWGYKNYDKPNTVHNRAMRTYLGVHKYTSVPAMYGDMGWTEPGNRRKLEIIRFWLRLNDMDNDRLTKKVFKWDKTFVHNSWASDVRKILVECNLEHLYNCEDPTSVLHKVQILNTVKDKLLCKQKDRWELRVAAQDKLRFYRLFKQTFEVEEFVRINLNSSHRSLLSQLRYGILPLKIETGRYNKTPVNERLCQFCTGGHVESENHFVFECEFYEILREEFYMYLNNIVDDFITLNYGDRLQVIFSKSCIIRKFAVYIEKCYKKRSSVIYR
jgi:hypothetical protein